MGTLGGFVTKTDNERKTYALICNQFFDNENKLPIIIRQIYRICMYTTSSCDFAAIEITESVSNECVISLEKRGHCTYIYLTSHNIAILNKVIASFFFV